MKKLRFNHPTETQFPADVSFMGMSTKQIAVWFVRQLIGINCMPINKVRDTLMMLGDCAAIIKQEVANGN